jgi:AcrR family transcriptional regulator
MSDDKPRTKAEQRAATMHKLTEIARQVFASEGYAEASLEKIVQRAGVTRGALYHHFESKEGLFRAVLEIVQGEVAKRIEQAADAQDDLWAQLIVGCRVFLETSIDPTIQRIMLVDAPAVLGWETWRRIDAEQSGKLLEEILVTLTEQGKIKRLPIEALTRLLSGAMNEAALWIAQADDPQRALAEAVTAFEALLTSLKTDG